MQEFIVFLVVLAAVVYLARQWWPSKNKSGGCGGCDNAKKDAPQQLMQIQVKKKP